MSRKHQTEIAVATGYSDSLTEATPGRVLIISPVPTHPSTAGNRVRILRMARAIESLGHAVDFAHVCREQGDEASMLAHWGDRYRPIRYRRPSRASISALEKMVRKGRHFLGKGQSIDDWYDPGIDDQLRSLVVEHHYDTVIVEYVFMSRALMIFGTNVHKVIDTHDVFAGRNQRFRKQGQDTGWFSTSRRQEAIGLSRADEVIAIQSGEAAYFRRIQPRPVVTIGDLLDLRQPLPAESDRNSCPNSQPTLLLVSSNNPSNLQAANWFLGKVFSHVRQRYPRARLTVVGGLAAELSAEPGLELLGPVESLEAAYAHATVVINPVRVGTGLKIKSLEALAHGKPLVTTRVGGEGLEAGWNSAFTVADDAKEFAGAIIELLENPKQALALGTKGRRFAEQCNEDSYAALRGMLARRPGSVGVDRGA